MAHHNLDLLDKKILRLIAGDARIPFLEVARSCNVSGAAIHQRIQKLTNLGILKGSQFIIDPEKVGYETCAYIGLYLQNPASFDDVVEEQADFEVVKHKKFNLRPMSEEEAILQMNMLEHTFFMFKNAQTGEINVVYKRDDGNYAVLEPSEV